MVCFSHLFENVPYFVVIHTAKDFGIVNRAEIDISLKLHCFFHDPADVVILISGSSAFSNQLEHQEVHSSRMAEARLGDF